MTDATTTGAGTGPPPAGPRGRPDLVAGLATAAAVPALFVFLSAGGDVRLVGLGVIAIVLAVLALCYPAVGLMGMAVLTVSNASDNLIQAFGAPSLAKLAGPGLAFILGARWVLARERPLIDPLGLALFGMFGAMMVLSAVYAASWHVSVDTAVDYAKDMVIVLLTLAFFHRPGSLRLYMWTAIACLTAICVLCLYQYVTGDFSNDFARFARFLYDSRRLSGPINDPNFFAATLVFFIPFLLLQILAGRSWGARIGGGVLFAIFVTSLLLTQSRGALLALAAALSLFVLILDRRTLVPALGLGAVLLLAVGTVLSDTLIERFELILSPIDLGAQSDPAIEGRLASWRVAAELFFESPLLGVGAGNYNMHFQDTALELGLIFRGEGRSAHSLYLEILAELGVVGLVAFLSLAGTGLVGCVRAMRRLEAAGLPALRLQFAAVGIGLVGYLVAMVFLHDSYPRLLYTVIAVTIAMPLIARREIAARTPLGGSGRPEGTAKR